MPLDWIEPPGEDGSPGYYVAGYERDGDWIDVETRRNAYSKSGNNLNWERLAAGRISDYDLEHMEQAVIAVEDSKGELHYYTIWERITETNTLHKIVSRIRRRYGAVPW